MKKKTTPPVSNESKSPVAYLPYLPVQLIVLVERGCE
jgi:hypothetical protein